MKADELVAIADQSPEDEVRIKDELLRRARLKVVMMNARKAGPPKGVRDPATI